MKPHRVEYWLTARRADPEAFAAEVRSVCQTYLDAPALAASAGVHTVSIDEKTGMQALERAAPGKPLKPGLVEKREYEYKRRGVLCLFGALDVMSGRIFEARVRRIRELGWGRVLTVAIGWIVAWMIAAGIATFIMLRNLQRQSATGSGGLAAIGFNFGLSPGGWLFLLGPPLAFVALRLYLGTTRAR